MDKIDRLLQMLTDISDRLSNIVDASIGCDDGIGEIAKEELCVYRYFIYIIPKYFEYTENVDDYCNTLLHCSEYDFLNFINNGNPISFKSLCCVLYRIKALIKTLEPSAK